jgi:hypothetical protein
MKPEQHFSIIIGMVFPYKKGLQNFGPKEVTINYGLELTPKWAFMYPFQYSEVGELKRWLWSDRTSSYPDSCGQVCLELL